MKKALLLNKNESKKQTLLKNLKLFRSYSGLTQDDIAKLLFINRATYMRQENQPHQYICYLSYVKYTAAHWMTFLNNLYGIYHNLINAVLLFKFYNVIKNIYSTHQKVI